MDDTELNNNFFIACYHYAKNNGSTPTDDQFVGMKLVNTTWTIISWNHDSQQPSTTDLKAATLITVQQTWTEKENNDKYYDEKSRFVRHVLKDLLKRVTVLEGKQALSDNDAETVLKNSLNNFVNTK